MVQEINYYHFEIFKNFAQEYCASHGKKIKLINRKNVNQDGAKCAGWCDGDTMVVATKNLSFQETFVHEFSHMTQAVEGIKIWNDHPDIWPILSKKNVKIKHWPDFYQIIELERDCEKRALKFVKNFEMMDEVIYAKKANMYLYYYQYVFLNKKWHNSTSIYDSQEIYNKMPEKLLPVSHFKNINMEIAKMFYDFFYKKR